jgi:hypothetical protein
MQVLTAEPEVPTLVCALLTLMPTLVVMPFWFVVSPVVTAHASVMYPSVCQIGINDAFSLYIPDPTKGISWQACTV